MFRDPDVNPVEMVNLVVSTLVRELSIWITLLIPPSHFDPSLMSSNLSLLV